LARSWHLALATIIKHGSSKKASERKSKIWATLLDFLTGHADNDCSVSNPQRRFDMKATIFSHGDPSVNIGGQEATVDLPYMEFDDMEHRLHVTASLIEAFSDIFEERAYVLFDDQCSICLKLIEDCRCGG